MPDVDKWKAVIGKHLPKRARQMFRTLMLDIIAVDLAIKPSYLYDISAFDLESMVSLISELKQEQLITNSLKVVCVGVDCFIVNVDALKHMYEDKDPKSDAKLVDVSASLAQPSLCNDADIAHDLVTSITGLINSLEPNMVAMTPPLLPSLHEGKSCEVVATDNGEYYEFRPNQHCNITSVFGLLLGYPIVYWYSSDNDDDGNCLSMEPLVCVKVLGKCESLSLASASAAVPDLRYKHQIYSFSYPACMKDELDRIVSDWLEMVKHKVIACSEVFVDCTVDIEEVTCEAVCL